MSQLYAELPRFTAFDRVVDAAVYAPVPDDWQIGLSDVVNSTAAIAAGRYKAVNMAGAAVISAVMNALGHRDFPFVFGGDGASFVVPPADVAKARLALGQTARWVAEDLALNLRTAMLPVAAVRASGRDVRLARYAASPSASYAMFTGGGLAWAEAQAKAGQYLIDVAPAGSRPDLTGLSCRWQPLRSRSGTMLSLIVQPAAATNPRPFADLIRRLLELIADAEQRAGHPLPSAGPGYSWPPAGLDLEARASRNGQTIGRRRRSLLLQTLLALVLFRTGWKLGAFEPGHYVRQSGLNADFRKFDDGLRMIIDCQVETADALQSLLDNAERRDVVRFGLHRQTEALMTCIVPSIMADDHLHFIDGAGGGYAMAALQLKSKFAPGPAA
jgi:Protein of unknown function (DUF3095)